MTRRPFPDIPKLSDDPEYRAAAAVSQQISRKRRELQVRVELINAERDLAAARGRSNNEHIELSERRRERAIAELAELSPHEADLQTLLAIREKWRANETDLHGINLAIAAVDTYRAHRSDKSRPSTAVGGSNGPEITKALDFIRTGALPTGTLTPAERIAELECCIELLGQGYAAASAVVEEIRDRKALELTRQLREFYGELLVEQYHAAIEIARATALINKIRTGIVDAGYGMPRDDILRIPWLPIINAVGLENEAGSGVSRTRRALEEWGLI